MHHASASSVFVQCRRVPRPNLQAQPRWSGSRRAWGIRQTAKAIWMDPRDGVPVGERTLRSRVVELACAETNSESDPLTGAQKRVTLHGREAGAGLASAMGAPVPSVKTT